MPGNLSAAVASGVLPQTLSTAFAETAVFPLLACRYNDGTTERYLVRDGVNNPVAIRTWSLSKRLTEASWTALKAFIESHNGGLTPFYFYDPLDPGDGNAIGSNYDATGTATQGRHTCVFTIQGWAESVDLARTVTSISFTTVA